MVVVIITILVTMAVPSYSWLRERAGHAGCVSNLRIIHAGFNTYMQDHNMVWPQLPTNIIATGSGEEQEWRWWHDTLKDHDVARTNWICPSDKQIDRDDEGRKIDIKTKYVSSYMPTTFDDLPNTAFRWKTPWVIERGGFHYKDQGPNLLMPDGTVIQGPALY